MAGGPATQDGNRRSGTLYICLRASDVKRQLYAVPAASIQLRSSTRLRTPGRPGATARSAVILPRHAGVVLVPLRKAVAEAWLRDTGPRAIRVGPVR